MAFDYLIDTDINCVFVRHFDGFAPGDGTESINKVWLDPLYLKGMNLLRDTSAIDLPQELTFSHFKEVARTRKNQEFFLTHGCKFAWVVGSAKDYGYAHRWSVSSRFGSHVERKPFREMNQALAWFGLPEDFQLEYPDLQKVRN